MHPSTDHLYPDLSFRQRVAATAFPKPNVFLVDVLNELAPAWQDHADMQAVNFVGPDDLPAAITSTKRYLFIEGSVPSPIASGHAVAIKVNRHAKSILYKDPYGSAPPDQVTKWLRDNFPHHRIFTCRVRQQMDHISCTWMQAANILAWVEGREIDPKIQDNLDAFKFRVMGAAERLWPEQEAARKARPKPVSTGRIRYITNPDPKPPREWPCFLHLRNYRPRFRIKAVERPRFAIKRDEPTLPPRPRIRIRPNAPAPPPRR